MRHNGPEPPWRGETDYGRWLWVPPDARLWIEEPGYWQWHPPRPAVARILEGVYLPAITKLLNEPLLFMPGVDEEHCKEVAW